MKKVLLIIIASFFTLATVVQAEVKLGLSASAGYYDASAKETHGSKQKEDDELALPIGSIFAEYMHDTGSARIGFGVELIPYDIDSDTVENKRNNGLVNKAQVSIVNHTTAYLLIGVSDTPAFVKLGYSYADVETTETIKNLGSKAQSKGNGTTQNSNYGNDELIGYHVSLGYDHEVSDGFFVRGEAGYHQYDDTTYSSSSGGNKITAELSGYDVGIKIGKSF